MVTVFLKTVLRKFGIQLKLKFLSHFEFGFHDVFVANSSIYIGVRTSLQLNICTPPLIPTENTEKKRVEVHSVTLLFKRMGQYIQTS